MTGELVTKQENEQKKGIFQGAPVTNLRNHLHVILLLPVVG